jgi:hypothetical protein
MNIGKIVVDYSTNIVTRWEIWWYEPRGDRSDESTRIFGNEASTHHEWIDNSVSSEKSMGGLMLLVSLVLDRWDVATSFSRDWMRLCDLRLSPAIEEASKEDSKSSSVEPEVGALLRLRAQRGAEPPSYWHSRLRALHREHLGRSPSHLVFETRQLVHDR